MGYISSCINIEKPELEVPSEAFNLGDVTPIRPTIEDADSDRGPYRDERPGVCTVGAQTECSTRICRRPYLGFHTSIEI